MKPTQTKHKTNIKHQAPSIKINKAGVVRRPELEIRENKTEYHKPNPGHMILDLLSFMSKDRVSLFTRFNVT